VDDRGVLYLVDLPASSGGPSVERKLFSFVSGQTDASPRPVTFKPDQRVTITFVGDREKSPPALSALEGVAVSQLVLRLEDRRVFIVSAKDQEGKELLSQAPAPHTVATISTEQLSQEQKKWLMRRGRILELQHEPARLLSEAELLSTRRVGSYPSSVARQLEEIDGSFKILFNLELRRDAPKSVKAKRPSWAAEFLKIAHELKDHLDTPSPYFDALLTVLDPKNSKYSSMAHCSQMKAFLKDCTNLGLMPNLTEAGRAKIVVKPVIERLLHLSQR
jgi:hypothetical protein